MSSTGPAYGDWKESFLKADEAAAQGPQPIEELSMELKGLGALALIGAGLLVACGLFSVLSLNYVINGEPTTGVVVDFRTSFSRRHGKMYSPVVAYVVDGEEYCVPRPIGSGPRTYRLHQEVPVLYLPHDPGSSTIADFLQLYLFPTIFGVLGFVFLTGSAGLTAYIVRKAGWRLFPCRT